MELLKCCFGCVSLMGCKNVMTRRYAFFPPEPPGYKVVKEKGKLRLILLDEHGDELQALEVPWISTIIVTLRTNRGNLIPAIFLKHSDAEFTIIFSHGNSTDIGIMRNHMVDIATQLKANILIYEYTGYGDSSGKPSEVNMYSDIEAAYRYLTRHACIPWHKIILYGQSLGSSPTCHLAAEVPVAGVVLHSPIASGLLIFSKQIRKSPWYDVFKNIEKIPYIRSPVFIVHGVQDKEVPIRHSEWLSRLIHFAWPPWWVQHAGHNDIDILFRQEFFERLRKFLYSVSELQSQFTEDEIKHMFIPFDRRIVAEKLPPCLLKWPEKQVCSPKQKCQTEIDTIN